jgi:hypothetical protein
MGAVSCSLEERKWLPIRRSDGARACEIRSSKGGVPSQRAGSRVSSFKPDTVGSYAGSNCLA